MIWNWRLKKWPRKQNLLPTSSMSMHQPQKKQRHSLVRYRKCVIIRTSYAKKWISTLTTVIGGNFNAEIGKRIGSENCISQWLRGRRNESGSKLAEFCEMSNKVITNSCFQHPSKHITTWFQRRINPTTKIFSNTYNQIDYIILYQK